MGLATENGFPFVLGEGLHVRNSRVFQFIKTDTVNQQYIRHGTIHIIRVPQVSSCRIFFLLVGTLWTLYRKRNPQVIKRRHSRD